MARSHCQTCLTCVQTLSLASCYAHLIVKPCKRGPSLVTNPVSDAVPCVTLQAIRKSFLSLFTRKALNTYVRIQDGVIRDHVGAWLSQHSGMELDVKRIIRCAVACATSA